MYDVKQPENAKHAFKIGQLEITNSEPDFFYSREFWITECLLQCFLEKIVCFTSGFFNKC